MPVVTVLPRRRRREDAVSSIYGGRVTDFALFAFRWTTPHTIVSVCGGEHPDGRDFTRLFTFQLPLPLTVPTRFPLPAPTTPYWHVEVRQRAYLTEYAVIAVLSADDG